MKFHLEPVNHDKISDLCGPTNSILKQIEEELGIKILNRGASFRIKGETSNAQIAKNIILRIYDDLEENKTISSEEVHLYLRKGMNDLKNMLINADEVARKLLTRGFSLDSVFINENSNIRKKLIQEKEDLASEKNKISDSFRKVSSDSEKTALMEKSKSIEGKVVELFLQ